MRSFKLVGKLALAALVACSLNYASTSPGEAAQQWNTDINKSLDAAKHEQKYALADVYTDWCGWCKKLDRDTFSDSNMQNYLKEKFVCIKVNAEDRSTGTELASKYKVDGFPCALVFDPNGKFIGKISGYRPASEYQEALNALITNPPADPYQ